MQGCGIVRPMSAGQRHDLEAEHGRIQASPDGLTLGALAELESAFGDEDMIALAERFGRGRLSARDAARIIGAGLRGALSLRLCIPGYRTREGDIREILDLVRQTAQRELA